MINQVVLTGNLGRDPELRYSASGMPIATFSLCFKSGKDKTGWVNVVSFNKLAENIASHLSKGSRVGIIGVLDENKWEDNQGSKRSTLQVICNNIEFIKTNRNNETQSGTVTNQEYSAPELPF